MEKIINTQEIVIDKDALSFEIDAKEDIKLSLKCVSDASVFFSIINASNLEIEMEVINGSNVSLFFSNDSDNDVDIKENYSVNKDSKLSVSYSEFNDITAKRYTSIKLLEEGAEGTINSASLVNSKKDFRFIVENVAANTFGKLNNYAVVLKEGRLMIDAIGKIDKGARGSESHQTSRALSFADGQKTTILPELLIDENDVKASHAMSIGRMDDDQLYYLMSRGLSVEDCTSLVSAGYLYPIFESIKDEDIKNKLKESLERKLASL